VNSSGNLCKLSDLFKIQSCCHRFTPSLVLQILSFGIHKMDWAVMSPLYWYVYERSIFKSCNRSFTGLYCTGRRLSPPRCKGPMNSATHIAHNIEHWAPLKQGTRPNKSGSNHSTSAVSDYDFPKSEVFSVRSLSPASYL
jgi:hypothetical protein